MPVLQAKVVGASGVAGVGPFPASSELLSCWPYRHGELEAELRRVGLPTDTSTFDPEAENYMVAATAR
jgi:hypothetical protein